MNNEKIKFKLAKVKDTYWTGRIGTVCSSYKNLVERLGEPHNRTESGKWESRDGKTRFEWAFILKGEKDIVFTIYDYKNKLGKDEIKEWSLGARENNFLIIEFLKSKGIEAKI